MSIDILVITHRWPRYACLSLETLLESCDDSMRVWIWHNGNDRDTFETARRFSTHSRVVAFRYSRENVKLREPTNWMWNHAKGDYLSKVDDDCLVSPHWAQTLRRAHEDEPRFGVIGSWRFYDEDYIPDLAEKKIAAYSGGHRIMRNPWVQGSGYLMKRECLAQQGLLRKRQSFTNYCLELACRGYVNGWYYPFIHEEHLDDPRSPLSGLSSDEDLLDRLPLSAQSRGITTLEAWTAQMRDFARTVQAADPEPLNHMSSRQRARCLLLRRRWRGH